MTMRVYATQNPDHGTVITIVIPNIATFTTPIYGAELLRDEIDRIVREERRRQANEMEWEFTAEDKG